MAGTNSHPTSRPAGAGSLAVLAALVPLVTLIAVGAPASKAVVEAVPEARLGDESRLPPPTPTYAPNEPAPGTSVPAPSDAKPAVAQWTSLFDGKSLAGWKTTEFGGEGDVLVENGHLILTMGNDMTGVTSTRKDLPKSNYEIRLEGCRMQGTDFFCGLTFPVNDNFCSLILGGWGGGVCGLSSIDGFDASENSTSTFRDFEPNRWYTIRLRVTDPKIEAWIGDEKIIEQELEERRLSTRVEVDLSKPLGFSTWRTTGGLRNIQLRAIDPKAGGDAAPAKP